MIHEYSTPPARMAEIFRMVPRHLARTARETHLRLYHKPRFCCYAVDLLLTLKRITPSERADVCEHIQLCLEGQISLESWLREVAKVQQDLNSDRGRERVQQHRRQWMEVLAKEFES